MPDENLKLNADELLNLLIAEGFIEVNSKDFPDNFGCLPFENEKKFLIVNSKEYKIIMQFPVMHIAFELDTKGYIVEKDNKPALVLSNHSHLYFANIEELQEKLAEYQKIIQATKKALTFLTLGN